MLLVGLGVTGCVTPPRPQLAAGIQSEQLAAHVNFLAQPALKGRKPGTYGSRLARRYIESRFEAYGLVPWADEKDFTVSFGYGKNIVGVLPGSDPALAGEFVVVCAHYDHQGKDKQGRIFHGAADNASGVAALLEAAEQLSRFEERPKRSVAFIAFDSEERMLFGSFAFTCRPDVQAARIAAVINVDILGRDFLDVVSRTIFVTGTEQYPELRRQISRSAGQSAIRALPIGTDLIGPRGDHVAFEHLPVPCLFFSSGMYKDYHQPTDTADKLNYQALEDSARVILDTIREVANRPQLRRELPAEECDPEELRTISTVMNEVIQGADQAGVKQEDIEPLRKLAHQADELLRSGRYDRKTRGQLMVDASGTLVPYLLPIGGAEARESDDRRRSRLLAMQYLQCFYINHRTELMEGYRKLIAHVLYHRPGPFRGMPKFEYEICQVKNEDICLASVGGDQYALNALIMPMSIRAEVKRTKWLLESFGGGISGMFQGIDAEGTKEELADICLLRLRSQQKNPVRSYEITKVLRQVMEFDPELAYPELLAERIKRGGFKDEADWVADCILSTNPDLALEALWAGKAVPGITVEKAAAAVVADRNARGDLRAIAIEHLRRNRSALLALCDVLDDPAPGYYKDYLKLLRKDYPFSERLEVKTLQPLLAKQDQYWAKSANSIGDIAEARLKKLTGKDFGKEAGAWRNWIEAKVK